MTAPADQINDFEALHARQTAFNEYKVLNLSGDKPTAYAVDTANLTCTCKDEQFNNTDDNSQVCKHLAYALFNAPQTRSDGEHTLNQISRVTSELAGVTRDLQAVADGQQPATTQTAQSSTESADTDDSTDTDDSAGDVVEADPDVDQGALMDDLASWFNQSAGMAGYDPSIIDLSWGRADGTEGIIVEREPFTGEYYADGDWVDKDAFDNEKEKVTDAVLSPNDAFDWYGEPDYQWFISSEDATELVE